MTVFDEKRESACSICFSNVFFKRIFHSIDSLPLTDYKKIIKPREKNAMHVCPRIFKISWSGPNRAGFTIGLVPFKIFA